VIPRVLIACQPASEGVAVCVAQHTRAALDQGYDVTVVCPEADRGPLAGWVAEAGAKHVPLNMVRAPSPNDFLHARALRRLMAGFDLVHAHSSKAGALIRLAAMTMRRPPPIIFSPHAWSWHVGGGMSRVYLSIERVLARQTDVFVAVGEREAAEGRSALRAREMVVVPNGVDVDFWSPDGPRAPRSEGPLVVCVGRLSRQKGQDLAIHALARMRNREVTLRLLGDGPARNEMETLAHALGVSDRVEFWGSVPDPDRHLRAADIVIVPSRWDGMSLALLEAMAVGTAIIATDVSGSEALGDAGVVVPVDDVSRLSAAMDELIDGEIRRRELADAARRASLRYSLDENLRGLISVWDELLGRPSATLPRVAQRTS
jgi:glycosyltransferase involved in cell wall biosynthesis